MLLDFALCVNEAEWASSWGPTYILMISQLTWISLWASFEVAIFLSSRIPYFRSNRLVINFTRIFILGYFAWYLISGSFNEAPLRTLPINHSLSAPSIETYLDEWIQFRKDNARPDHPYPAFIVVSEGGGIRAAYWTATLLAAVQDEYPEFADHVLALSGVSGGSVGVSIFAALMEKVSRESAPDCLAKGIEQCARSIGRADLLSPALTSMLIAEPLQRLTGMLGAQDRAITLERALERAWHKTMGNHRLALPFGTLVGRGLLVFPNATSAATGDRIVVSAFEGSRVFQNTRVIDGRSFAFSTAALVSARFPVISPVAIYDAPSGESSRMVDGGYSDNSGAATGADILRAFNAASKRAGMQDRFRPAVIAITYTDRSIPKKESAGGLQAQTIGSIIDPVTTLDAVRNATSKRYLSELRALVKELDGEFLDGMQLLQGTTEYPLGWTLSDGAAEAIDQFLDETKNVKNGEFQRIGALMGNR